MQKSILISYIVKFVLNEMKEGYNIIEVMIMMFGRKLKSLRERKEMSQGEVAKHFNLTNATYSRYENGIHQPDYDMLKRLANYFNVSIDYLLDNEANLADAEKIIDLRKFIMNGNYTVQSRFPTGRERRMLNNIINAVFEEREMER